MELYCRETGWKAATAPVPTREEAQAMLPDWQTDESPARVYEAIEHHTV